ncbi:hypothetical protein Pelo_377 [Pelomyxa schiedti]|nr:hypothetical protein Pelo_377 [Pelomyxa schiedti]
MQGSFGLGCVLFELAMGQNPLPGYPEIFRNEGDGLIHFGFESEEMFPIQPPFPKKFCDLVRGLLQFDPSKRIPLVDAHRYLLDVIETPTPDELLSFYTHVFQPSTSPNDAGSLTCKATCQLLCGGSAPVAECVCTLREALQASLSFPPALLLLHHIHSASALVASLVHLSNDEKRGIASVLINRVTPSPACVELKRAIIDSTDHRTTFPEVLLTAMWNRYLTCPFQKNKHSKSVDESHQNTLWKWFAKLCVGPEQPQEFQGPHTATSYKILPDLCASTSYEQTWSDKIYACSCE